MTKALIIVDLQNDFMPDGALGVRDADEVIPIINDLMPKFPLVVASQDWHPSHHISFAERHELLVGDVIEVYGRKQKLWPVHCVQHTEGAKLVDDLHKEHIQKVALKGTALDFDSYSVFADDSLDPYLKENQVKKLYFAGLTTDYCVRESVYDAVKLGYQAYVIVDACKAVQDQESALQELKAIGAKLVHSTDF